DSLKCPPFRLHPENEKDQSRSNETYGQERVCGEQCGHGGGRRNDVGRSYDQRQSHGPQHFSKPTEAVRGAHPRAANRRGPHFGRNRPNNGKTPSHKNIRGDKKKKKERYRADENTVPDGSGHQEYGRAKAYDGAAGLTADDV